MDDNFMDYLPTLIFFALIGLTVMWGLRLQTARIKKREEDYRELAKRKKIAAAQVLPLWPPRQPDDWGMEAENAYRLALNHHQMVAGDAARLGRSPPPPPPPPVLKSWEAHNRAEQDRDPLQIRWAQNEVGDWIKVVWGNRARPPANGGALPVYQLMKREEDGAWKWVGLGVNVSLDWQRGPQRMERIEVTNDKGGASYILRPCGSPAHQDAPAPLEAGEEHGSSDWQSPDDLARLGIVSPR